MTSDFYSEVVRRLRGKRSKISETLPPPKAYGQALLRERSQPTPHPKPSTSGATAELPEPSKYARKLKSL